jgi:hypothetical protein
MIIENDYDGHRFLVQFLRPYLQCWRCEKPFGCLQLMLRLYLMDHLWLRVRVRVRVHVRDRDVCLVGIDVLMCVCMYVCVYIYIYKEKKVVGWNVGVFIATRGTLSPLTLSTGDSVPR